MRPKIAVACLKASLGEFIYLIFIVLWVHLGSLSLGSLLIIVGVPIGSLSLHSLSIIGSVCVSRIL